MATLRGALAAAATPLREGGEQLDEAGFEPLTQFLADAGLDGILALGTTGEGILLSVPERRRVTELFLAAAPESFAVAVHCGAQTTAATVALAAHAAESGAAAVAVIGPPYFQLDEQALLAHFVEAARAAAPTPFYAYELEKASGYAIPLAVLHSLRDTAPNFVGMKVSDAPWERFEPYLIDGLDILVGPESLIDRGMAAGAVGAVSALATAFPEAVAAAVRTGDRARTAEVAELRATIERFPRHAALKHVLRMRGVHIEEDVRRPLRGLSPDESAELDRLLANFAVPIAAP
jgi:dihydrodipicolinate synthase/N-acetylneuraminate lyase